MVTAEYEVDSRRYLLQFKAVNTTFQGSQHFYLKEVNIIFCFGSRHYLSRQSTFFCHRGRRYLLQFKAVSVVFHDSHVVFPGCLLFLSRQSTPQSFAVCGDQPCLSRQSRFILRKSTLSFTAVNILFQETDVIFCSLWQSTAAVHCHKLQEITSTSMR